MIILKYKNKKCDVKKQKHCENDNLTTNDIASLFLNGLLLNKLDQYLT